MHWELTQTKTMFEKDSGIRSDGIALDDLSDEELDKGLKNKEDISSGEEGTPEGSQPEQKTDEGKEGEAKPDEANAEGGEAKKPDDLPPFHEHPRFKELIQENKELKDFRQRTEPLLKDIEEIKSKFNSQPQEIPEWFKEAYGDDENLWAGYVKQLDDFKADVVKQAKKEFVAEQQARVDEQKQWDNWANDECKKLEDEGKKFDKNELMKVLLDYRPIDLDGNISFQKGFDIYEALQKGKEIKKPEAKDTEAKKKIANISSQAGVKLQTGDFLTPLDLRHKSFKTLSEE